MSIYAAECNTSRLNYFKVFLSSSFISFICQQPVHKASYTPKSKSFGENSKSKIFFIWVTCVSPHLFQRGGGRREAVALKTEKLCYVYTQTMNARIIVHSLWFWHSEIRILMCLFRVSFLLSRIFIFRFSVYFFLFSRRETIYIPLPLFVCQSKLNSSHRSSRIDLLLFHPLKL